MKIAFSSQGMSASSILDQRFGRTPYYAIYDDEARKWQYLPNPGAEEESGAGIKIAQMLVNERIDIVLTGRLGPKASRFLEAAGIKIYLLPEMSIFEALENFQRGNCEEKQEGGGPFQENSNNMGEPGPVKSPDGEKIAIATEGKMVAKHFGRCPAYTIVEIKKGNIESRKLLPNPGHEPGFLPRYLENEGVSTIIAGGMGRKAQEMFAERGIRVILGAVTPVDEIIHRYLTGDLKEGISLCKHDANG